ncbi:hypothetical protein EV702DRAFT_1068636 [Suillus placidus]|uniref:Uncharacterized protein n=1 Tax=Suillus placidus TaxID=48579 RepID=A0A9P7D7K7_9AGAM|nr:hypothetical protein EV702DRAFT_1068636 [Suillus placidus]
MMFLLLLPAVKGNLLDCLGTVAMNGYLRERMLFLDWDLNKDCWIILGMFDVLSICLYLDGSCCILPNTVMPGSAIPL